MMPLLTLRILLPATALLVTQGCVTPKLVDWASRNRDHQHDTLMAVEHPRGIAHVRLGYSCGAEETYHLTSRPVVVLGNVSTLPRTREVIERLVRERGLFYLRDWDRRSADDPVLLVAFVPREGTLYVRLDPEDRGWQPLRVDGRGCRKHPEPHHYALIAGALVVGLTLDALLLTIYAVVHSR